MKKIKLLGFLSLAVFMFSFTSLAEPNVAEETEIATEVQEENVQESLIDESISEAIAETEHQTETAESKDFLDDNSGDGEIIVDEPETEAVVINQQITAATELSYPITLVIESPNKEKLTYTLESGHTDVDLENGIYKFKSARDGNNKKLKALYKEVEVTDKTSSIYFGLYLEKSLISVSAIIWREIAFVIVGIMVFLFFKNYLKNRG